MNLEKIKTCELVEKIEIQNEKIEELEKKIIDLQEEIIATQHILEQISNMVR